jgi:hypothetical protein
MGFICATEVSRLYIMLTLSHWEENHCPLRASWHSELSTVGQVWCVGGLFDASQWTSSTTCSSSCATHNTERCSVSLHWHCDSKQLKHNVYHHHISYAKESTYNVTREKKDEQWTNIAKMCTCTEIIFDCSLSSPLFGKTLVYLNV